MIRVKTFNATGVAPDGRLYAGDLNAIQDAAAGLADFTQTHDVGTLRVGDSAIQLLKFATLDARITAALRTDGILRGLGGLFAGTFTTATRNAIAAGSRPFGLIIFNTDNSRHEVNIGSDAVPNWQPLAPTLGTNSITATELADNAVDTNAVQDNAITNAKMADNSVGAAEIQDGSVSATELAAALKPSGSAGDGTEALRALGLGAGLALGWGQISSINRVGTLASRPAANAVVNGTMYFASDQVVMYISDGSSWYRISPPAGATVAWFNATAPSGFVKYDGTALPSSTGIYADLATHLGGTATPDTRGRVIVGLGTNGDVDAINDNDGMATVADRRPKHKHTVTGGTVAMGGGTGGPPGGYGGYQFENFFVGPQSNSPTDGPAYTTGLYIAKL